MMKSLILVAACLSLCWPNCIADTNFSSPLSSHQILPDNFKPPQVFKNANLLRNINLEKSYVRETVNVVIENIDSKDQEHYYIPFTAEAIGNVGGLEVRDKKNPEIATFLAEVVEYDPYRWAVFQRGDVSSQRWLIILILALPNSIASPCHHLLPRRRS